LNYTRTRAVPRLGRNAKYILMRGCPFVNHIFNRNSAPFHGKSYPLPTRLQVLLDLPLHPLQGVIDGLHMPVQIHGDLLIGFSLQVARQHLALQIT